MIQECVQTSSDACLNLPVSQYARANRQRQIRSEIIIAPFILRICMFMLMIVRKDDRRLD